VDAKSIIIDQFLTTYLFFLFAGTNAAVVCFTLDTRLSEPANAATSG
jgi:hypothetical protein